MNWGIKVNRSQKIDIAVSVALMIIVVAIFYTTADHAINFHHNNSYFIFSSDFAAEKLYVVGGLSDYIAAIVCSNVALCTLFIGFVSAYLFYVLTLTGQRISHLRDPFFGAIIPVTLLLAEYINIVFISQVSSMFIIAALLHLLINLKGKRLKIIFAPILIALAYLFIPYTNDMLLLLLYCAIYLIYTLLLVRFIGKFKKAIFVALPITLLISFYIFQKEYNPRLKYVMQMEELLNNEKWEEVLKMSAEGVVRNKQTCYYTNIALLKTNNFSNHLFHYPQIGGVEGLKRGQCEMQMSDLIFDILGIPAEALHCSFENYVRSGKNYYNLPKLIYYYDKTGKKQIADRFAAYLPSHKRVTPTGYISQQADSIMVGTELINTLEDICKADSTNQVAYEYLMAYYAMSGRIVKFAEHINQAERFFGNTLPSYYEDIILLYKEIVPKDQQIAIHHNVAPSKVDLFNKFKKSVSTRGASPTQFRSTYWYYNKFINPSGERLYID